jgi:hypothetical protein
MMMIALNPQTRAVALAVGTKIAHVAVNYAVDAFASYCAKQMIKKIAKEQNV